MFSGLLGVPLLRGDMLESADLILPAAQTIGAGAFGAMIIVPIIWIVTRATNKLKGMCFRFRSASNF